MLETNFLFWFYQGLHKGLLFQVIVPGSIHPQGEALIHFLVFILDHKITLVMTENTNQMVLLSMISDLMKILHPRINTKAIMSKYGKKYCSK